MIFNMVFSWKNFKNKFRSAREISTISLANIGGSVILGIFWLYMANLLETHEYGQISYFLSIASVASIISIKFFLVAQTWILSK